MESAPQPGPVAPEELEAFAAGVAAAFHDEMTEAQLARIRPVHEHDRALAIRDEGRIVATTTIWTTAVTAPGGPVPMAGVTAVGVRPTHRRRGLLTALMRAQLDGLRDGGEPLAGLWASQAEIYGRFGYGVAADAAILRVRSARAALRPELRGHGRAAALSPPADALAALRARHDRARPGRPGLLQRSDARWQRRIADPEDERGGARALRAVVVRDRDGEPEGYALYAVTPGEQDNDLAFSCAVREALATGPRAAAAVWEHLLGLDLVTALTWDGAPADCALVHRLVDRRAVRLERTDALWLRLVDADRALAARTYARELDVVLQVDDPFCPWNAGRRRLSAGPGGATCAPTTDAPDLRLGADVLGALYLGGPSAAALAAAGRIEEITPGAAGVVAAAFRAAREPWCPEIF
jgi:predicted acetyltransferase